MAHDAGMTCLTCCTSPQLLGHNQISSLEGLAALSGGEPRLKTLDVRGNALTALSQLTPLVGLCHLTELRLDDGATGDKVETDSWPRLASNISDTVVTCLQVAACAAAVLHDWLLLLRCHRSSC